MSRLTLARPVDRVWLQVAAAVLLLVIANLVDLLTTYEALEGGASEVNPIGSWLLRSGLALEAKLLGCFGAIAILVHRTRIGDPTVALGIVAGMGAALVSIAWSNTVFLGV